MTFREKLQMEHPEYVNEIFSGGCRNCPSTYGYEEARNCVWESDEKCAECWNREMPGTDKWDDIVTQGIIQTEKIGYLDGYDKGLNDAWELAKKLDYMAMHELEEIFDVSFAQAVLEKLTPQEALAKLKDYEEQSVVKRGDCVKANGEFHHFYGIYLGKDGKGWTWILSNNDIAPQRISDDWKLEKTGEHVDLDSILEQIGE